MANTLSKKLGHPDDSGFYFVQEMLGDNVGAAINFDMLQKHPQKGYIIFEFLLCEETQKNVTPYTSHPKRYWNKNKSKFLALWRASLDLNATLYLVNYAKKGTKSEQEILLIEVLDMDETGILQEKQTEFNRKDFSQWFIKLSNECLQATDLIVKDIYNKKSIEELGNFVFKNGIYKGYNLNYVYEKNKEFLKNYANPKNGWSYRQWIQCYLEKREKNKTS
jgi:hypothetical protein